MGTLTYDSRMSVTLDDRVLAHLQVVVWAKLRRGERFALTWTDPLHNPYGRTSVWVSPSTAISFEFVGGRTPAINGQWVDVLMRAANSPSGLYLIPEPPSS